MKRESHLFSCHKFLEEAGSQILHYLAKVDFRDSRNITIMNKLIENYITVIANHTQWEEEFIFNKFFTKNEVSTLSEEHFHIEGRANKLIEGFKMLLNLDPKLRVHQGKLIYLNFRFFYAANLIHFHCEETNFLSLLQERASDDEIRAIDKPIYQAMNSCEIVEMLKNLLPPINFIEKKNILDDLRNFNSTQFNYAIPEIQKILTQEEVNEIFVK